MGLVAVGVEVGVGVVAAIAAEVSRRAPHMPLSVFFCEVGFVE